MRKAASHWQQGQQAKQPHGKNCVDVEFYVVKGQSALAVAGTTKISMNFDQLFPSVTCPFGPLMVRIPRTAAILEAEYGKTCLTSRVYKQLSGSGTLSSWLEVPFGVRRAVWPTCSLKRCAGLTNGNHSYSHWCYLSWMTQPLALFLLDDTAWRSELGADLGRVLHLRANL